MTEPLVTIVVVEDENNIRRFIKLALESQGFVVFEADSLKRGLIEAGTRRPDLVVLDLGLPDGVGNTGDRAFGTQRRDRQGGRAR